MSRIAFFNIPAYGHTNPTLEVVRELVKRGHEVHYYSFREFRDRIENTGAACICCDEYMPPAPADIDKKVGRDLASLISMTVHVTLAMEERILKEFGEWKPDCIVSDSICIWGKLYAKRLGIPYVCSTTTFAFNRYTAKLMKQKPGEIFRMMAGMSEINARNCGSMAIRRINFMNCCRMTMIRIPSYIPPRNSSPWRIPFLPVTALPGRPLRFLSRQPPKEDVPWFTFLWEPC